MVARAFTDVEIGETLPPFERKTGFMNWNRYAAVNDEFVHIHMDDAAGRNAGQPGAFGMGNLRAAYILNMLRQWAGDEAQVRELALQHRAINHKDDVLTTHAVVTATKVQDGQHLVVLDVGVRNQDGVDLSPGTAIVALPAPA